MNVKKNWKIFLAAALTGACMTVGLTAYALPDYAAAAPYKMQQSYFDADGFADGLSAYFGVKKDSVAKALKDGWRPGDLCRASAIAYASDKSLDDVLSAKTASNRWFEVAEACGVTREREWQAMRELHQKRLASQTGCSKSDLDALQKDGYTQRDIVFSAVLAKQSGKNVKSIIEMKKINNRWEDVAASLGVEEDAMYEALDDCMHGAGFGWFRRGPWGPRPDGFCGMQGWCMYDGWGGPHHGGPWHR